MIKILVLQQLYNLADDALEYQLLDRRSFLQFLGLTDSSTVPDTKTIWLFLDRLAQAGLGAQLFDEVQQQLRAQGYLARCGQIIDASPVQRNKRKAAEIVKQSIMPTTWTAHKRAQKDVDAKWTKCHGKNHFGYKLHASVDKRYKAIRKVIITDATRADTTVYEYLLDTDNISMEVYADRGYPSAQRDAETAQSPYRHAACPRRARVRRAGQDGRHVEEIDKKADRWPIIIGNALEFNGCLCSICGLRHKLSTAQTR